MDYLYAPWRTEYVTGKKSDCVFCDIAQDEAHDEDNSVLYRDSQCFVVMNKYPYTPGHLLVVPLMHTDAIENLDEAVWLHMSKVVRQCSAMLRKAFRADGINIGMNLGKAAGAGIAEHVHYHIMPRWFGDTNFITTIADTRVFSNDFQKIYTELKENINAYVTND